MGTKQFVGYVPVVHAGYLKLFDEYGPFDEILILGETFAERFRIMRKDIRRLTSRQIVDCLRVLDRAPHIRVVEVDELESSIWADVIIAPIEDVTLQLLGLIPSERRQKVEWVTSFLRWDEVRTETHAGVSPDMVMSTSRLPEAVIVETLNARDLSSDWWRQVGAVIFQGDDMLRSAGNRHWPSDYSPYIDGDPRANYRRGINIDLSTALHAEQAVIGACARDGLPLREASMIVSTFPCPACARLIAAAGITTLYYFEGYAMLDGAEILRGADVRIVHLT